MSVVEIGAPAWAGLALGAMAAAFGLIDFVTVGRAREHAAGWINALGNAAVLALALLNLSLRLGSAEAAILPWGLWRSLLTTALLAVTGWPGGELAYRPMIGVTGHDGDEAAREHRGGSHRHAA